MKIFLLLLHESSTTNLRCKSFGVVEMILSKGAVQTAMVIYSTTITTQFWSTVYVVILDFQ